MPHWLARSWRKRGLVACLLWPLSLVYRVLSWLHHGLYRAGILKTEHQNLAANQMMELNKVGQALGELSAVTALTDVTGFGLLGHLTEMAEGSNLSAVINFDAVPIITPEIYDYIQQGAIPGGTTRNRESYEHKIGSLTASQWAILADPQTSGGLLVSVNPNQTEQFIEVLKKYDLQNFTTPIGYFTKKGLKVVSVK